MSPVTIESGPARFQGKVVLVSGAGKGLGRAIAEAFAAEGAIVAANDLTPINLSETARQIRTQGGQVKEYLADMAKSLPVRSLINEIIAELGRLDILINNAAVRPRFPLFAMDEWDWQRTLDVNLSGPFFAIQAAGKAMRTQGGGIIINVADAMQPAEALQEQVSYAASKFALIGLTWQAAQELSRYQIHLHAVCPRWSEVPAQAEGYPPAPLNPAQTLPEGCPKDTISAILFLCSAAAASLYGQIVMTD